MWKALEGPQRIMIAADGNTRVADGTERRGRAHERHQLRFVARGELAKVLNHRLIPLVHYLCCCRLFSLLSSLNGTLPLFLFALFDLASPVGPPRQGFRGLYGAQHDIAGRIGIFEGIVPLVAGLDVAVQQRLGQLLQTPKTRESPIRLDRVEDGFSSDNAGIHDSVVENTQNLQVMVESMSNEHGLIIDKFPQLVTSSVPSSENFAGSDGLAHIPCIDATRPRSPVEHRSCRFHEAVDEDLAGQKVHGAQVSELRVTCGDLDHFAVQRNCLVFLVCSNRGAWGRGFE